MKQCFINDLLGGGGTKKVGKEPASVTLCNARISHEIKLNSRIIKALAMA
jgi:hypothetical protein